MQNQKPKVPFQQAAEDLSDLCRYIDEGAELNEALKNVFNEVKLDHRDSVDRRCVFLQHLEGAIATAEAATKGWQQEEKRLKALLERIEDDTKKLMEAFPGLPYQGNFGKLKIVNNGGVLPLDIQMPTEKKSLGHIISESELVNRDIPTEYYRATTYYTLVTDAIRESIEAGTKVDWASLKPRGTRLKWELKAR